MKTKIKLSFLLCLFSLAGFAQGKMIDKYVKGEIALETGETIPAYVYISFTDVDLFQNSMRYITPEAYDSWKTTGKLKSKNFQKLKPNKVKHFNLENGKKFTSVTYADLSALGTGPIPRKYFFEEISSGKIKLYKKYDASAIFIANGDPSWEQEFILNIEKNYELLIFKEDKEKNAKSIATINLLDYISDKSEVLEKFNADKYGRLKSTFSTKIKSAITHPDYLQDFLHLLKDYNI